MERETCAEKVRPAYNRTVETITDMMDRAEDIHATEDEREEAYMELSEYGLEFTFVEGEDGKPSYWRYLMSWGGPSDEFRFYVSPNGRGGVHMDYADYHYMDWHDGAHVRADNQFATRLWERLEPYTGM